MLNRKKIIIFLSIIAIVAGCNGFVVPASFIVPGMIGKTANTSKIHSSMSHNSKEMNAKTVPLESPAGVPKNHISGTKMSEHISGNSADHISGGSMSEHISGNSADHISGASVSDHISGASISEHLSGGVVIPEHFSGK